MNFAFLPNFFDPICLNHGLFSSKTSFSFPIPNVLRQPLKNYSKASRLNFQQIHSCLDARAAFQTDNNHDEMSLFDEIAQARQEKLLNMRQQVEHLKCNRIVGEKWRRNAWWAGIPLRVLRSHSTFQAAPVATSVTLQDEEDLILLRRDGAAFDVALRSFPLEAASLPALFGIPLCDSRAPDECDIGDRNTAKLAWIDIVRHLRKPLIPSIHDRSTQSPLSFEARFELQHCANAALAYVHTMKDSWHHETHDKNSLSCDAVRLREAGICAGRFGGELCAATPLAFVVHRQREDFWMWGTQDCILLTHVESPFAAYGSRFSSLCLRTPPTSLSLQYWMEVQFALACCGPKFRTADVALYSPFGGAAFLRVDRDDNFLAVAHDYVRAFMSNYVLAGIPPPVSFWSDLGGPQVIERARLCYSNIETIAIIKGDMCESYLEPARAEMSNWETERAQKLFFVPNWSKSAIN